VTASRRAGREGLAGLALASLLVGTVAAWMAGWTWIAVPSVVGILGLAAIAIGADSRRAGDWKRVETSSMP
jgi:CHASE2 domain-containing sensor protein